LAAQGECIHGLACFFKIKGATLGWVQRPFSMCGILRSQADAVQGFDAVAFFADRAFSGQWSGTYETTAAIRW